MKKIWKFFGLIIIILMIIGIFFGISLTLKKTDNKENEINKKIFSKVQIRQAEVTEFFTYGTSLNFSCKILGISKDNYESARLIITDGKDFEKTYKLYTDFVDNNLKITTSQFINNAINLEELEEGNYFILIRLKVNNSKEEKYYLLKNKSNYQNIQYYSISKNEENHEVHLDNVTYEYNRIKYEFFKISKSKQKLPDNVYDIVIDAGHGGNDKGHSYKGENEANIVLNYAYSLKEEIEKNGLKVKLTRTNENNNSFTETNNYNPDGRISIACSSKAKYMISLHMSDGNEKYFGVELYCPCKSNLDFAKELVKNITEMTTIQYSNDDKNKNSDGVYIDNFTNQKIETYAQNAERNGYEKYNLTLDTPSLFTIREVGGIATNAFMDGRNKVYSANKYYNSNQGIECYELHLGYMRNDIEKIKNEKTEYINAIVKSILNVVE